MFEIKQASVKLVHSQTRMEGRGDELVPAVDMSFTWCASSSVLDALMPRLRATLFMADRDGEDKEPRLDLHGIEEVLPYLRLPNIDYPLKLTGELAGMSLAVGCNEGSIELGNCTVKKFKVTPLEGGSVELGFLVQCSEEINEIVAGWLDMWQQRQLSLHLVAGELHDLRQQEFDVEDTREAAIAENAPDGKKRKPRAPKEYVTGNEA